MNSIEGLKTIYGQKKEGISSRLDDFRRVFSMTDETVFSELAFCICTPQSKAKSCDSAIKGLIDSGLLFSGSAPVIAWHLFGVRFHNNKARYIVAARDFFTKSGFIQIKETINKHDDIFELREFLVKNILGIGMKEASHFLRNIGMGDNIAILDRHILKNMQYCGAINNIPKTISKNKYLELERKLCDFSKDTEIPLAHLDLLFWSKETGEIFK
ncbi:MAG: N-glycosylase/DNA lyase [Candidatus Aenigmarchaeota archaeon]|nr:N-glycosylase/DNA lyase [Candidatus Aenigmarchaeota archaeon]